MTRENQILALILIALGLIFLLANLDIFVFPQISQIFWPSVLILAGVVLLVLRKKSARDSSEGHDWEINIDGETFRIGGREIESPLARLILGTVIGGLALLIAGLVIFGVVGPVLLVVLGAVGVILLVALGIPLLALLIPLAIVASPIILIIWLLSLLF